MNKDKETLYKELKNMTLEDFISIFLQNKEKKSDDIINYNLNNSLNDINYISSNKILYTVEELLQDYPFFTRYSINEAIKNKGLPYCVIGKRKMFNKSEVDKWIDKETQPKKDKKNYLL